MIRERDLVHDQGGEIVRVLHCSEVKREHSSGKEVCEGERAEWLEIFQRQVLSSPKQMRYK
jgi:hypothetical protein